MNRKPDYRLKFLNKETEEKGELGGAWLNKDGSITIVLDPKVCLMQDRHEVLTLFPQVLPKKSDGTQPRSPINVPVLSDTTAPRQY